MPACWMEGCRFDSRPATFPFFRLHKWESESGFPSSDNKVNKASDPKGCPILCLATKLLTPRGGVSFAWQQSSWPLGVVSPLLPFRIVKAREFTTPLCQYLKIAVRSLRRQQCKMRVTIRKMRVTMLYCHTHFVDCVTHFTLSNAFSRLWHAQCAC